MEASDRSIVIEGRKETTALHKIREGTVKQLRMHVPLKNVGETCSVDACDHTSSPFSFHMYVCPHGLIQLDSAFPSTD